MASRLAVAVVSAFAISLLIVGAGGAASVCDPHCAPAKLNQGGEVTGLNRANSVAGDHGAQGRANAVEKQDLHKPGGSGVISGDTGGGSTGGTDTGGGSTGGDTGGGTPGPCSGC
jgi:hypothetical protein